ncbi:hypothetical protein ACIQF6_03545 [Kitasatospora sp. NPDC092948]|uniref:hypothetical protein n=1 Tax=Kitasatospora sp. NPDC092948 TaxID=3364088 RepID=UPI003830EB1C
MNPSRTVDQDDVLRARTMLLASGRRTYQEEVDAYRVLAQVSPAAYLPRLAEALQRLSYDTSHGKHRPNALALCEEAVAAARAVDPADPRRADVLVRALDSCQSRLYAAGRRTEGLALRAEMLAVDRAQAERSGSTPVRGLGTWAAGLSEEGRHAEAADAQTERLAALLPGGPRAGALAWSLIEWAATLADAGRADEALAAFGTLVDLEAEEFADNREAAAHHFHVLVRHAELLDRYGRGAPAAAARQSALAAVTELTTLGRTVSSGYQSAFWAVLLSWSAADSERLASDGPYPASGAGPRGWSADTRQRYFDSLATLRTQVDALAEPAAEDPGRYLAELLRLHRVLTVRSAVRWQHRTHLFAEQVEPLFDEGVELARQLADHNPAVGRRTLAEVLIDRSAFHTTTGRYRAARDDFREALGHLGEDH